MTWADDSDLIRYWLGPSISGEVCIASNKMTKLKGRKEAKKSQPRIISFRAELREISGFGMLRHR